MLLNMVQLRSVAAFLSFAKPGAVKKNLVERIVGHLLGANGAEHVPAAVVPLAVVAVAANPADVVEDDGNVSEEDVDEEQESGVEDVDEGQECGVEDDGFVSEIDSVAEFTSDEDDEDES